MIRFTRPLKPHNSTRSTHSARLTLSPPTRIPNPSTKYLPTSPSAKPLHLPRRNITRFAAAMETDRKPSPDSDAPLPDDFVHVHDLNSPEPKPDEEEGENSNSSPNANLSNPKDSNTELNSETSQNPNQDLEEFVEGVVSRDGDVTGDREGEGEREDERGGDVRSENQVDLDDGGGENESEVSVNVEELLKNVVMLECESSAEGGVCDVYLVGTAHVSQESCREVKAIISYLKPQAVFLELCASRVAILSPQNLQVPTMQEMMHMWKKRNMNIFGILYSWFLAKVANELEVFPGSEFRVAYEEAIKYGGRVILGDRPVQITLRRTWGRMTLWHRVKFLYSMLFQAVFLPSAADLNKMLEEMDDVDMLTLVIQEMSKAFPTLMETLLFERDLYMSSTLLKVAKEHRSVVAVVGKGHLQGIKKNWKQPVQLAELLTTPQKSGISIGRILTSVGVVVAGAAIVTGIYYGGKR